MPKAKKPLESTSRFPPEFPPSIRTISFLLAVAVTLVSILWRSYHDDVAYSNPNGFSGDVKIPEHRVRFKSRHSMEFSVCLFFMCDFHADFRVCQVLEDSVVLTAEGSIKCCEVERNHIREPNPKPNPKPNWRWRGFIYGI